MSIEWFRDLVICVVGVVVIVYLVFMAVLFLSIYRRVKPILASVKTISGNIEAISTLVREEVTKPLIQVAVIIRAMAKGYEMVTRILKNRKEEKHD